MLALFTELPGYCPNCGTQQVFLGHSASEFLSGVSFDCRTSCGLSYAYLTEQQLIDAASENGSDLERMLRLGGH
jgi:hypothetical protein